MNKDLFERKPFLMEELMESLIFGFEHAHPDKANTQTKNPGKDESIFLDQSSVIGETVEELVFGFEFAHPEKAKAIDERKQQLKAMRSSGGIHRDKGRGR